MTERTPSEEQETDSGEPSPSAVRLPREWTPAVAIARSKTKEQRILFAQGYTLLHLAATGWLPERDVVEAMLGE